LQRTTTRPARQGDKGSTGSYSPRTEEKTQTHPVQREPRSKPASHENEKRSTVLPPVDETTETPNEETGDAKRGDSKRGDSKRGDAKRGDSKRGSPATNRSARTSKPRRGQEEAECRQVSVGTLPRTTADRSCVCLKGSFLHFVLPRRNGETR
jgi:hypothetical protein